MKTHIIHLNRNDDYLSVRDKMSWNQTGRILLVWPSQGHVLNRQLDLTLLKRHAATMGAQLALVTHDSIVRFYAQQIGLPVFDSPRHAQEINWSVNLRRTIDFQYNSNHHKFNTLHKIIHPQTPAWLEHPATRFVCFGLSVFALLALGIYILPSAKIILSPQVEIQSMIFELSADPSSTSINLSTGSLPAYSKDVIVEGRDTITASGSVVIPNEPATGGLKFTNISNQKISIPTGTIVTTLGRDPVRFITSSIDKIMVNPRQSIVLTARAIKQGSSGNLPPDHLVAIEGENRLDLTVTNPSATYGGTDSSVPSPTITDLQILRSRLSSKLKQDAFGELQSILPEEDTLISSTLTIIETLAETYLPSVGEPGNQIELSLRLRVESYVVSVEALRNLVIPIMDSNTPIGYSPLVNTLEIIRLSNPTLGVDGKAHWTIHAARKLQVDISADQAAEIIKGSSISQAVESLSAALPLAKQTQIVLTPAWWPRLPLLTLRMDVVQSEFR